jgi:hypothetical protein
MGKRKCLQNVHISTEKYNGEGHAAAVSVNTVTFGKSLFPAPRRTEQTLFQQFSS